MNTTLGTVKTNDTHTNLTVNAADIMWPIFGIVVVVMVFLALKWKFFPRVTGQLGDKKLQIGGVDPVGHEWTGGELDRRKACQVHAEINEGIDRLVASHSHVERRVMGMQMRAVRDFEDSFWESLVGVLPRSVNALWDRFREILWLAAVENHVVSKVDENGRLDPVYLDDKVTMLRQDHRRISTTYDLPEWGTIERKMTDLFVLALTRFVAIAQGEWKIYLDSAETVAKMASSHPQSVDRIRAHLENVEA